MLFLYTSTLLQKGVSSPRYQTIIANSIEANPGAAVIPLSSGLRVLVFLWG